MTWCSPVNNEVHKWTLSNGYEFPIVSFHGRTEQAVKDAIDIGYRHFETASYWTTEREV